MRGALAVSTTRACQRDCANQKLFSLIIKMFFPISSDYEASLKKEGGIPDGPVLESLLAGETLDKKVETKEEEPMSECQVRPPPRRRRRHCYCCSALSHLCCCWCREFPSSFSSFCIALRVCVSLSVTCLCFCVWHELPQRWQPPPGVRSWLLPQGFRSCDLHPGHKFCFRFCFFKYAYKGSWAALCTKTAHCNFLVHWCLSAVGGLFLQKTHGQQINQHFEWLGLLPLSMGPSANPQLPLTAALHGSITHPPTTPPSL